ncbi:hypothetical protein M9H77_25215 [Catharanthus roseus]|uniref:Glycosyltransferase n=2 Tax=Catharanthus roseus TaxID=4058 RepID=C5NN15_CATRO|nr:hypothetical protein M9H77_25215 [Catharanthus roseus]BAH80313.1 UDP-glucose:flavonoid glucoside 1,6-glucosyltransferase [Catharanthus roseus]
MATEQQEAPNSLKILMFPWLAFGHVSPFLQLAKKLSDRGFYIYICSTPINLDSIKNNISQNYSSSIQLVHLHLPNSPQLPPSLHTTNALPPHLMSTLKSALIEAKPELCKIMASLKPDLIIHDVHQQWTAVLASKQNIPAVSFSTMNAVSFAYIMHMFMQPGSEFPFKAIYLSDFEKARLWERLKSDHDQASSAKEKDPEIEGTKGSDFNSAFIVRSSREIEGKYLDYITEFSKRKVMPVCLANSPDNNNHQEQSNKDGDELIQWLETKSERSSVFVSFGSEYFLNKQEFEEISLGLELSNVNFIWVLRFPKGEDKKIEQVLPEGYLERVEGRGRIVQGWAPQAKILGHPNIGGFVSHCGWNSVMESIEIGVPIIAIPMITDQPFNARLAVEIGVGVEVRREENGKVKRESVAEAIKEVVVMGKVEKLRKTANDFSKKMKNREKEELDEVVGLLKQLRNGPSSSPMSE